MLDRNLKILIAAAEVAPFAKTGGLADVAGSLPKALATMGNDVRIVMPKYRLVDAEKTGLDFPVEFGTRRETGLIREAKIEAHLGDIHKQIPVYLIDNYHYFDREGIYCHHDDGERFAFFCKAILEMLPIINFQPDIIHLNDWQTGPVALMLKEQYSENPFYKKIATVFTVHNLQYQGVFPKETMQLLHIPERYFVPEGVEFFGSFNFMKAGLNYADIINTVSRTYAQETQTPQYGEHLDGLMRKRARDLYGIVNGINYHEFNPQTDPRIYRNYDGDNFGDKKENKYALQKEMGLPVKDLPVLGLVSRLVDQKGLDLIADIVDELLSQDIQFILLGEGEERYQSFFAQLQQQYPDKVGVQIGFNGILAQRIYAGADIFLMPSKFEPCGLGQLISLRYGTIPIVRATGGLADTVSDYHPGLGIGNGFVFTEYKSATLLDTVNRAIDLYQNNPEQWQKMVVNALKQDFSWNKSAAEYLELYDTALANAGC
jgi:starch synthase